MSAAVRPVPAPANRRRPGPAATPLRGLLPLAGLLITWQLIASRASLSLPPPDEWLKAIARMHDDGVLMGALARTLSTFLIALGLATVVGALLGMVIGASRRMDRALTPSLDFVVAVPAAVFVPVAILLLGTTLLTGVAIVVVAVVWPILLNTAMAMRTVPPVRLEMSRTLGLSHGERWRKVMLPSLAPGTMLGVRVARRWR